MKSNETEGVCYAQPTTLAERLVIARDFVTRTGFVLPLHVDRIDGAANAAFAAWPERLYVVDAQGRIAYKGEPGPFGFDPDGLDAWLDARAAAR